MDDAAFKAAYSESRNGADYFVRHPLVRRFQYSNGVKECADAGCHWLLDIVATEIAQGMREFGEPHGYVVVKVSKSKALITFEVEEGKPLIQRRVSWTDMPEGTWTFEIADELERTAFILTTEH
jgi:hypothetical protein